MLKILEAADEELSNTILMSKGTSWTKSRQEKLLEAIKAMEAGYSTVFSDEIISDLKAFADREGAWTVDQLGRITKPYISIDFVIPSAAQIYAAAEASFLIMNNGVTLDMGSIIDSVFGARSAIIEQSLRQGFILGKTTQEMARELLGTEAMNFFDGNIRRARTSMERVVRTTFSHMSGVARDEVYSRNDDLVKGYKWVSTLDSRTCFTEGHNILTPSGNREISEIVPGDVIYNGKKEAVEVIKTLSSRTIELIEIELNSGDIIRCTPDHLLLTTKGEWIEAQNLTLEYELQEAF
jgi:hypothetical protein